MHEIFRTESTKSNKSSKERQTGRRIDRQKERNQIKTKYRQKDR